MQLPHPGDYQVVELRRYVIREGECGALPALMANGLLQAPPEVLVLDPTPRSRLRWLPAASTGATP